MTETLHYILASCRIDGGRMGSLEGYFITTHAKLAKIKELTAWYHDVLGKHSEIHVKFAERGVLEVVSEDQAFVWEAARVFKVNAETGHLMGFDPFVHVWDGKWEDEEGDIPVPWFQLDAPDPA